MACATVSISRTSFSFIRLSALTYLTGVLVNVVSYVRCGRSIFMLAIVTHCSPCELQRQQKKNENCQPLTHVMKFIS